MKLFIATGILLVGLLAVGTAAACDKEEKAGEKTTATEASAQTAFDTMPPVGTKAKCLVMDQEFTVSKNTASSTYKGKTYVFCCPGCKPKFEKNPEKYLKK